MSFYSIRNVIPPTQHMFEVICQGHTQWKGSRAHPYHSIMPIPAPKPQILDLIQLSRSQDSIEPSSMPFHSLRNIIPPTGHTTDVIYPGHMQWKGSQAHPHRTVLSDANSSPKPQNHSNKSKSGELGTIIHAISLTQECHSTHQVYI